MLKPRPEIYLADGVLSVCIRTLEKEAKQNLAVLDSNKPL